MIQNMKTRFRKKIKLLLGIWLNVSKTGLSISIGKKGASLNLGKHGARTTVGLPGSGLSASKFFKYPKNEYRTKNKLASSIKSIFKVVFIVFLFLLIIFSLYRLLIN